MAKWTVGSGIDNYVKSLEALTYGTDEMIKRSVYKGAKIVTDAIRKNIDALPVGPPRDGKVTRKQKAGLQDGLGISQFRMDGSFLNVKVGMDGYNTETSKKHPKGQANAMIARALESGSSFAPKHPFIGPAVNATKASAEKAIAKAFDEQCEKLMK